MSRRQQRRRAGATVVATAVMVVALILGPLAPVSHAVDSAAPAATAQPIDAAGATVDDPGTDGAAARTAARLAARQAARAERQAARAAAKKAALKQAKMGARLAAAGARAAAKRARIVGRNAVAAGARVSIRSGEVSIAAGKSAKARAVKITELIRDGAGPKRLDRAAAKAADAAAAARTSARAAKKWPAKIAKRLARCSPTARACIDLTTDMTWLQSGGKIVYGPVPITAGRVGYPTRTGTFPVFWKNQNHRSSIFNNAPMPYSVFFDGGIAYHVGSLEIASHGCIHLSWAAGVKFFEFLRYGDHVHVFGKTPYAPGQVYV